jgi:hypothetical protein
VSAAAVAGILRLVERRQARATGNRRTRLMKRRSYVKRFHHGHTQERRLVLGKILRLSVALPRRLVFLRRASNGVLSVRIRISFSSCHCRKGRKVGRVRPWIAILCNRQRQSSFGTLSSRPDHSVSSSQAEGIGIAVDCTRIHRHGGRMPSGQKRLCMLTVSSVIQEEEETSSFLVASSCLPLSVVRRGGMVGCPCREASDGREEPGARREYLNCVRQAISSSRLDFRPSHDVTLVELLFGRRDHSTFTKGRLGGQKWSPCCCDTIFRLDKYVRHPWLAPEAFRVPCLGLGAFGQLVFARIRAALRDSRQSTDR